MHTYNLFENNWDCKQMEFVATNYRPTCINSSSSHITASRSCCGWKIAPHFHGCNTSAKNTKPSNTTSTHLATATHKSTSYLQASCEWHMLLWHWGGGSGRGEATKSSAIKGKKVCTYKDRMLCTIYDKGNQMVDQGRSFRRQEKIKRRWSRRQGEIEKAR